MVDFSKLKQNRGSTLAALTAKLDDMNKGGFQKDERIYKPGFSKTEGKGYAVVRFLPNAHGDNFVRVFSHSFNGPGGWYIENSRSTIGEDDPVGLANQALWNKAEAEGNEAMKNIAKKRKRATKYYACVYVVKDQFNPDAVGKVMIYEFGPQIFKKIEQLAKPEFEDDKPIDPFDMWSGADFKIKIVGKEMPSDKGGKVIVPNYENSEFAGPSEFLNDDEEREAMFKKTHDLSSFLKVKSFDELAERYKKVTGEAHDILSKGGDVASGAAARLVQQQALASNQTPTPEPQSSAAPAPGLNSDDDDDLLAQFRALAGG